MRRSNQDVVQLSKAGQTVTGTENWTHLRGQLGSMGGSVSAAVLQTTASPLLKTLLVTFTSKPGEQSAENPTLLP